MTDIWQLGHSFDFEGLLAREPVLWTQGLTPHFPVEDSGLACLSGAAVAEARQRFERFAPLFVMIRPDLSQSFGHIESPLQPAPALQHALQLPPEHGTLLVKCDNVLPMAGSVTGGVYVIEAAKSGNWAAIARFVASEPARQRHPQLLQVNDLLG